MNVMSINRVVLTGNLSNDVEPTDDQVGLYADRLQEALESAFPGAEVDITVQNASGSAPYQPIVADDEDAVREEVENIEEEVWGRWLRDIA